LLGVPPRSQPSPKFAFSILDKEYAEFVSKLRDLHGKFKHLPVDRFLNAGLGGLTGILGMFSEEKRKVIIRRIIMDVCK
jgi:hypothetical protein